PRPRPAALSDATVASTCSRRPANVSGAALGAAIATAPSAPALSRSRTVSCIVPLGAQASLSYRRTPGAPGIPNPNFVRPSTPVPAGVLRRLGAGDGLAVPAFGRRGERGGRRRQQRAPAGEDHLHRRARGLCGRARQDPGGCAGARLAAGSAGRGGGLAC